MLALINGVTRATRPADVMRALLFCLLVSTSAFGQGSVLQGGPWAPGRVPMYVGQGTGQAIVQDSGPAGGGSTGLGVSELLLTARGIGTPPYAAQGTGPDGTNFCNFDAPTDNPNGYHYVCMSPNATVGGVTGTVISTGSGGAAAELPFYLCSNGACVTPNGGTAGITVGATTIGSGTDKGLLYDNAGVLGNLATLANGLLVTDASGNPSISTTVPGGVTFPITVGTTPIVSGTPNGLLFDSAGVFGNLATANNGVLVTSAGGVPSISMTLPNSLGLGTPASGVLTNATGYGVANLSGAGSGVLAALAVGVGNAGAPVLFNGAGGTPTSMVGTNITGTAAGLTAGTASAVAVGGITGAGAGCITWLTTPSSANLRGCLTDESGTGVAYFQGGDAGTPSALVGTNITGTAAGLTAGTFTAGSASNLTSGTLAAARGGAGTVNGVLAGNGSGAVSQGTCAGLSGVAASCATDATNATNITSGTLPAARLGLGQLTNSLSGDVSMTSATTYFTGPTIAQGSTGIWFVSGTVTLADPTAVPITTCKLWDGTTVIASAPTNQISNSWYSVALSGYLATPAGNLRISCSSSTGTTNVIRAASQDSTAKASTISAFRIN